MTAIPSARCESRDPWRTYTTADGLAGQQVEHLAVDGEGHLWCATWGCGASRFDGGEFRTYTSKDGLSGNKVTSIHLDRRGRLWFGAIDGGACWYDGGTFHRLDEGPAGPVGFIFEDSGGRLWFGGSRVLGYWDGACYRDLVPDYLDQFGAAPSDPYPKLCWGIAEDGGGRLWFGFDALVCYDGARFARCDLADDWWYYAVGVDAAGVLWVANKNRLWRLDGDAFAAEAAPAPGSVRKLRTAADGALWCCTTGGGALRFDGGHWRRFCVRDGLASDWVNDVLLDADGQTWFATWGGGISCRDPDGVRPVLGAESVPGGSILPLCQDGDGVLWSCTDPSQVVVTNAGVLNRIDGGRCTAQGAAEGLEFAPYYALFTDRRGRVWAGGTRGVSWREGGGFAGATVGEGRVTALAEDSRGRIVAGISAYVGTARGKMAFQSRLSRLDDGKWVQLCALDAETETPVHYINKIAAADGGLWFGQSSHSDTGSGRGLGRWDPSGGLTFYAGADGLVDDRVEDLAVDANGDLWIATLGGVSRYDGACFVNYTVEQGLPHDQVRCVRVGGDGHLWFGTEGGVARYDGRNFQTLRAPALVPTRNVVADRERGFWFVARGGLVHYAPARRAPRVRIDQIIADEAHLGHGGAPMVTASREIAFEYGAVSLRTPPRDLLYSCRLKGRDEDWRPAVGARRVRYRDLDPGHYVFEVKAIDRDLNYSAPAAVAFEVVPDPREERIGALEAALRRPRGLVPFIGRGAALQAALDQLATVADTDVTVLILGETGTGKGLAAQAVHQMSRRSGRPFIQVNCGAIAPGLVESELFGHERGAFTGAVARKIGHFELADGGTIFLDEIGDLPLDAQRALLHVLQDGTLRRVGGQESLQVDARVVAATNRDLQAAQREGRFRSDLFYRLSTFVVSLPPLRQRREDIPLLAEYFVERFARHLNRPLPRIAPQALALLQGYAWPGNVRELEHLVQRAVLVCRDAKIRLEDLSIATAQDEGAGLSPAGRLRDLIDRGEGLEHEEKALIQEALEMTGWRISGERGAARLLDMHPERLRGRMRKFDLRRPAKKQP